MSTAPGTSPQKKKRPKKGKRPEEPVYPRPAAEPAEDVGHLTADQVTEEKIEWVWEPILPRGRYCLIEGDEGVGKSLMVAKIIADLTGGPRIDGGRRRRPGRPVMYLPAEEGLGGTVRPRLRAAGACLPLVSFGPLSRDSSRAWRPEFPHDLARLEREIQTLRPAAVIFEPLVSFFAADCSWRDDQQAKKVLDPLSLLAEQYGCLMLGVRHWKKDGKGEGTNRGMGSKVVSGNARVVLQLARDDSPRGEFALALPKFACLAPPPPRGFKIVPGDGWAVIQLGKTLDLRPDEMGRSSTPGQAHKTHAARLLLRQLIGDGWVPAKDLVAAAKAIGISDTIFYEAKARDKVPSRWQTRQTPKYVEWGAPAGGWERLEALS